MKIFVHVGYPKSASTTLQKWLFSLHSQINYLWLFPTSNLWKDTSQTSDCLYLKEPKLRQWYNDIILWDTIEYYQKDVPGFFDKYLHKHLDDNKINVFSHEALIDTFSADRGVKAQRIFEHFPDAHIVIMVRNQFTILRSQYDDRPFDPRSWVLWQAVTMGTWLDVLFSYENEQYLPSLCFAENIAYYENLFGKDKVHVLCFDELVNDKAKFCERIATIFDIDVDEVRQLLNKRHENKTITKRYNRVRSLLRRFGLYGHHMQKYVPEFIKKKFISFLQGGKSKKSMFPEKREDKVSDYFRESNKKLRDEYWIDVEKYKYPGFA